MKGLVIRKSCLEEGDVERKRRVGHCWSKGQLKRRFLKLPQSMMAPLRCCSSKEQALLTKPVQRKIRGGKTRIGPG
jgi:hypothetical protein